LLLAGDGGRPQRLVLGVEDYQYALITYSANAATFPRFVLSAYHGHYDDWARDAIGWRAPEKRALINLLIDIGPDTAGPCCGAIPPFRWWAAGISRPT
jgi:hypothetical protein